MQHANIHRQAGRRRLLDRMASLPVALRLAISIPLFAIFASVLFYLPGFTTRTIPYDEVLFTTVSALTVTGLITLVPAADLTPLGQLLLIILSQIGGIGFMIVAVVIFTLLGRRISLVDRLALRNSLGAVAPGAVLSFTWRVLAGVFFIELIGGLALWQHWQLTYSERVGRDLEGLGFSLFHAISAFCNAGFDLFTGSDGFQTGIPTDPGTLTIISILVIIGGLGVPVITDLLALHSNTKLSLNTRLTLGIIAFLIVAGGLGIFASESISGQPLADSPWYNRLGIAFFQSVSARSGGFNAVPGFHQLTSSSQFLVILLMFIGAAPASMGGGITTGTAAALGLALWSYMRNRPRVEMARRSISSMTVQRAISVLLVTLLLVVVSTWLLLASHPAAALESVLFEVVSAVATCGITLAFTGQLNLFGKIIIMILMIFGRIGPLAIFIAMGQTKEKPLVEYPEEQILIG
ncbi:MAG: potassium transporter [Chloroflexi bacterium]|nr:potassium transporter [Chloroflexota bacterium]